MRPIFVFDAYGTLFDVHAAMARHRSAIGPDAERFSDLWRAKQLEYTWTLTLAGRYAPFDVLTARALDYALAQFPSIDRSLRPALIDAYVTLDPYPDARSGLAALQEKHARTAILSNGTPRWLAAMVAQAGLDKTFEAVLSVDPLRMYKPRAEVYELATSRLRCDAADVVFVSSNRWDVMGAATFGFRAAWVNRAGLPDEYPEATPFHTLRDLAGLVDLA